MKIKLLYPILFLLFLSFAIPQQETKFVGSKKSTKYHYLSCKWAKKINPDNLIEFKSVGDAQSKGYKPCKVCKPPKE